MTKHSANAYFSLKISNYFHAQIYVTTYLFSNSIGDLDKISQRAY